MESHQPDRIIVATTRLKSRSREWQVVLAAVGIASTVQHEQGDWHLSVAASDAARSREELGAFEQENAIDNVGSAITDLDATAEFETEQGRLANHSNRKPAANVYSGAVVGGLSFLVVITFCQILQVSDFGQINWFQLGCMNAGDVRSGQWWRAVTALLLHRDTLHLMSNALFGSIFGYLVAKKHRRWSGLVGHSSERIFWQLGERLHETGRTHIDRCFDRSIWSARAAHCSSDPIQISHNLTLATLQPIGRWLDSILLSWHR